MSSCDQVGEEGKDVILSSRQYINTCGKDGKTADSLEDGDFLFG